MQFFAGFLVPALFLLLAGHVSAIPTGSGGNGSPWSGTSNWPPIPTWWPGGWSWPGQPAPPVSPPSPPPAPPVKPPVCIIGAGPAGLTAANRLEAKGYETVIFDKQAEVGGKCQAYYEE